MVVRIGILGAAGIAPSAVILPAKRREDAAVVAVASRRNGKAYAERHGIRRAYPSYEELLADPEVDLVYNALPPSLHEPWTIAAAEAGKHVLCEKPFTMTAAEAEEVVAAGRRSGRLVVEAFHDAYHPLQAWVREFLASGALGAVRRIDAVFTGATPYDPASIRHDPAVGGGALMDLGCYPVHWVRSLFGEPEVRGATADLNPLGADLMIEARLAVDDVPVRVLASMAEGNPLASTLTVEGERGRLFVDNLVFPSNGHSITTEIDGLLRKRTVAGEVTYDHQLAAVVDALASGAPLPTGGDDPIGNMRVLDAIHAAAGMPWPPGR